MKEKTMTTKEVAVAMGVRKNLIQEVGKRLFPSRMVHGQTTRWTEAEVTAISAEVKRTAGLGNSHLPRQKQLFVPNEQFESGALGGEKTMTTREVAEAMGVAPHLVQDIARRLFPSRMVHGQTTRWTEAEVTEISKEVKCTAGLGNSSLPTDSPNQRCPSTRQEVLERAGSVLKDLMQVIAEMNAEKEAALADKEATLAENAMLRHQVEYNEVIGCSRWSDIKRLLGIRDKWSDVAEELDLEEGVDFFKKCMGYDSYPTILLPDNTVNRIKEYFKEEY